LVSIAAATLLVLLNLVTGIVSGSLALVSAGIESSGDVVVAVLTFFATRTHATKPNQIWVGDVTYLTVGARWWYLIVVLDQCSRRVLAWRLAATRNSRVTRAVLDAALRRRRPDAGLIFHTDRGSEFQGTPVRARLAASGVRQSMTRGGAPGENAHMESFFHSLKADVIHGRSFQTITELRQQLRRYVPYYNYRRLHSSLGYQSPVDYERRAA